LITDYHQILQKLLDACKKEEYCGYNKHDGLLSPSLNALFGRWKVTRLAAIQLIMRSPVNVRGFFCIPKTRNPKGIGLFAHAYLDYFMLYKDEAFLEQAIKLLSWLEQQASKDYGGVSWGYQYPWQDVGFFAPAHFPNRVVTCWIGFSFYKAWEITKKDSYLEICRGICRFLREAPNRIIDTADELCLSYVPDASVTWAVMDVSALAAKMFALTGAAIKDEALVSDAHRCMRYIINRQTEYGAWYYTDPPEGSHITHDNYHTGIILDCIDDYMAAVNSREYVQHYEKGLQYYTDNLFLKNGAPKWMNNKIFPHDIHGSAQGIITFSKASQTFPGYLTLAEKILTWTMQNLYSEKSGQFWYQKTGWYTKRFTLMRWCNAWMAVALAGLLTREQGVT